MGRSLPKRTHKIGPHSDQRASENDAGQSPNWMEPAYADLLRSDPMMAGPLADLLRYPFTNTALSDKERHLILIAVYSSATTNNVAGLRHQIALARAAGACDAEIIEVLELASVIGIHTASTGMPILLEEMRAADPDFKPKLSPEQQAIKEDFIAKRNWWSDFLEAMVLLDAEFLAVYTEFSSVPAKRGTFSLRFRELVFIAIDCQTTHLYTDGLRSHIRNALKAGAKTSEIIAVFTLLSRLGLTSIPTGLSMLGKS